jgi:CheY-like chemotaxis protein
MNDPRFRSSGRPIIARAGALNRAPLAEGIATLDRRRSDIGDGGTFGSMEPAPGEVGRQRKCLAVDESLMGTRMVRVAMDMLGMSTIEAMCVSDAIRAFEMEHFDIVVTDSHFRDGTSQELIPAIKEANPAIPVLMLSGELSGEDAMTLLHPPDAFLAKPFAMDALVEKVSWLLYPR